jgi:hypothetical protein
MTTELTVDRSSQKPFAKHARALVPRLPRFGLKALFAVTTLAAWCSWQWSIAEKRERIARELCNHGCYIYRDATLAATGIERLHFGQIMNPKKTGEAIKKPVVAAVLGIGNWDGLTAMFYPSQLGFQWENDRINELARLPGLTTVLVCSANVEMLDSPAVEAFERKLRAKIPRVKIKRVVVPPLPLGSRPWSKESSALASKSADAVLSRYYGYSLRRGPS